MSSTSPPDPRALLPVLPGLARLVARGGMVGDEQLDLLLLGAGLDEEPAALPELRRWSRLLLRARGGNDGTRAAVAEALVLRGVPPEAITVVLDTIPAMTPDTPVAGEDTTSSAPLPPVVPRPEPEMAAEPQWQAEPEPEPMPVPAAEREPIEPAFDVTAKPDDELWDTSEEPVALEADAPARTVDDDDVTTEQEALGWMDEWDDADQAEAWEQPGEEPAPSADNDGHVETPIEAVEDVAAEPAVEAEKSAAAERPVPPAADQPTGELFAAMQPMGTAIPRRSGMAEPAPEIPGIDELAPAGSAPLEILAVSLQELIDNAGGQEIQLERGQYVAAGGLRCTGPVTISGTGAQGTEIVLQDGFWGIELEEEGTVSLSGVTLRWQAPPAARQILGLAVMSGEVRLERCIIDGGKNGAVADAAYDDTEVDWLRRGTSLFLGGDARATMITCRIRGSDLGAWVTDDARLAIEDSTLESTVAAVRYDGRSTGSIHSTVMRASQAGGLFLETARVELREVTSTENVDGLAFGGESRCTAVSSTCRGNDHRGMVFFDNAGGVVRGSTCRENGMHGIEVTGTASPRLEENTCTGNREIGVLFSDRARGMASGTICRANTIGIRVERNANPDLDGNECESNREADLEDDRGRKRGWLRR